MSDRHTAPKGGRPFVILPDPAIASDSSEWEGDIEIVATHERIRTLELQKDVIGRAVSAAMDWVREPDLSTDFMWMKYRAVQPFVFLGLHGIEVALKQFAKVKNEDAGKGHKIVPLIGKAREICPPISDVLQEEYAFWHDSVTDIHPEARFLHSDVDCSGFLKGVDAECTYERTRYFLVDTELPPIIDPRLLLSLWDVVMYAVDDLVGGRTLTVDALRRSRLVRKRYTAGYSEGDESGKRLAHQYVEASSHFLQTGLASDLRWVDRRHELLREWNRSQGILY